MSTLTVNTVGMKDWLEASKNMTLSAYVEPMEVVLIGNSTQQIKEPDPVFGKHIGEVIDIIRDWAKNP